MASVRFGTRADGSYIRNYDSDNLVGQAALHMSNLSHVSATLLLREAYDVTFGLYSEEDAKDPMNVMRMHPHEDHVTDGSVMVLMNRIVRAKLPSITGMSLLELMELPPCLLDPLLKSATTKVEDEARAAESLLDNLDNA